MILDAGALLRVLIWGLVIGSLYMLLATGLTLIFGVMKVVNFAHGELMIAGAFITFLLSHDFGLNPYLGVFAAMLAVGALGIGIERFGFRWLRGSAKINEVFFSIALILIIQNSVASVFVPRFRESVQIRTAYATSVFDLGLITLRYDFVILLALAWGIMIGLWAVLLRTRLGRDIRATSQNRVAALLMGIRVEQMDMVTFGIGAALAGLAGSLYGILNQFDPYAGTFPAIKAFAVIILGGLGSVRGAVVGGLLYGVVESVATFLLGGTWRDAVAFLLLIAVLLLRPQGLFRESA
ncbi:MAG: branched-chain amino acid ABC transporter permease [Armatimonadota bacterium]